MWFTNVFSQSFFLNPLEESFAEQTFLVLIKSVLSIFPSMNCTLDVKNTLPNPEYQRFSHFFPKSFIVCFTSKPMTHSELILYEVWDLGQGSFLVCGCSSICWKVYLYSIELLLYFGQKSAEHICVDRYLGSLLASSSYIISFEIEWTDSSHFILIFQEYFGYSGFFAFH